MKTSFIQPEKSNKTLRVSDKQISRLEPDDIKTEYTDSQSESSRDDIDVASLISTEVTSVVEGNNLQWPRELQAKIQNNQKDLEKLFLQICSKKLGGCDISRSGELSNLS